MLARYIPEGFKLSFRESLFNTEHHRKSQAADHWQSFYWLDEKKRLVNASWHLRLADQKALSPYRATFGGVDFSSTLSLRDLSQFISEATEELEKQGVKYFKVVLPPQNYHHLNFIKSFQAFSDAGYQVHLSEMVAAIPVTKKNFEDNIHPSERKKLKKAHKAGYRFEKVATEMFEGIYTLIAKCRHERGVQLSLSFDQLKLIIAQQPEYFSYYVVWDNKTLVAAAICIRVTDDVQYVFYGAHLKSYDKMSPTVMLYQGIYQVCQLQNISLLDFGTSPTETGTNHDLLDFKRYLGSELGLKITFLKTNG